MTRGRSDEAGMDSDGYPWYRVVQGVDLAQGDLLDGCPVFLPPADLTEPSGEAAFAWQERDVIVMTQTCDLVPGREKVPEVLLWELLSGRPICSSGLPMEHMGR